jgi:hypothetical protein
MYRERRGEIRHVLDEERGKAARGVSAQYLVPIGPVRYEPGNEYSVACFTFSIVEYASDVAIFPCSGLMATRLLFIDLK